MLHSAKKLDGMKVVAVNGEVGRVIDFYFDDEKWVIRHLVVDAGGWLTGRKVLLSPISVSGADWPDGRLRVNLSREQIENSPGIDTHKPVSRQHESDLYEHYGYPDYWSGPYLWGYAVLPTLLENRPMEDPERRARRERMERQGNEIHLRSFREVVGYHMHARDDTLGHLEDLLYDERDWSIRLTVVDPRNWWPGKHVLLSPEHIESVSWEDKEVFVKLTRAQIDSSPEYDSNMATLASSSGLFHQVRQ